MRNTPFKRYSNKRLHVELARYKAKWAELPHRRSFSAINVANNLDEIQRVLDGRGATFTPIYPEVRIEVGG
jgi:hypothetical protein